MSPDKDAGGESGFEAVAVDEKSVYMMCCGVSLLS